MNKILELADAYAEAMGGDTQNVPANNEARAALVSEVERMETENQRLLDDLHAAWQEIKTEQRLSFRGQVGELEAEIAALRVDAERYRYINDLCSQVGSDAESIVRLIYNRQHLDALISDQGIAKQESRNKQ